MALPGRMPENDRLLTALCTKIEIVANHAAVPAAANRFMAVVTSYVGMIHISNPRNYCICRVKCNCCIICTQRFRKPLLSHIPICKNLLVLEIRWVKRDQRLKQLIEIVFKIKWGCTVKISSRRNRCFIENLAQFFKAEIPRESILVRRSTSISSRITTISACP
jgi:hypothetical protein